MPKPTGRAFNEWLRAQLKAKKMSQRQLAQQSGVDHSTISRLVRGDRMPSLGTATKLARGLRELGDEDDGPQYLGLMAGGTQNPTARVEYALRSDETFGEAQVRQVMEYYLAVRARHVVRLGAEPTQMRRTETGTSPVVRPTFGGGSAAALNGARVAVTPREAPPTFRRLQSRESY
jgi:transcriptional regulator with XRE-family HTH domain